MFAESHKRCQAANFSVISVFLFVGGTKEGSIRGGDCQTS